MKPFRRKGVGKLHKAGLPSGWFLCRLTVPRDQGSLKGSDCLATERLLSVGGGLSGERLGEGDRVFASIPGERGSLNGSPRCNRTMLAVLLVTLGTCHQDCHPPKAVT